MALDFSKPVQTRDGRPVRILCTDKKGGDPILGLTRLGDPHTETVLSWRVDGSYYDSGSDNNDLINVPPPKVVTYSRLWEDAVHIPGRGIQASPEQSEFPFRFATTAAIIKLTRVDGKMTKVEIVNG